MPVQKRRLRDFPEIMDAERAAVLDDRVAQPKSAIDCAIVSRAAKAVCGVTHYEIHQWIHEATFALLDVEERGEEVEDDAWERAERQDIERRACVGSDLFEGPAHRTTAEVLAFYDLIGWDPTNEYGQVLRVAETLIFPFLAAAKGAGPARFPDEGTETARLWAERLAARPKPKSTGAPTPPISEEERRRRNAQARNSNVWRPARSG